MKKETELSFLIEKSNHLIFYCKINSVRGRFLIDTGASGSCIDKKKKLLFKVNCNNEIKDASSATENITDIHSSKKNILKIGNLIKENFEIMIFDMNQINNSLINNGVKPIDGIIGSDILKEFNAKIDYEKGLLSLKL